MALVRCEVKDGLRASEATAVVRDANDRVQFLPVDRDFLSHEGRLWYLPVALLYVDSAQGVALVELPVEADSGANRLWVALTAVRDGLEVSA